MIACGWLLASGAAVSFAAAASVTNSLSVQRIVTHTDGTLAFEPAATAKPGDLLEYVVDFHNEGPDAARGLVATLPLPVGTEFIAEAPGPAPSLASLDGVSFEPLPLKRVVRAADGSTHQELVPLREYRALRWAAADLPGNGDFKVGARVRVAANAS
jgi:uncharacterized repeat protein (TIGR01451 family)